MRAQVPVRCHSDPGSRLRSSSSSPLQTRVSIGPIISWIRIRRNLKTYTGYTDGPR